MSRAKLLYVATEDWYFLSDTLPLACAALAAGYKVSVAARDNGQADSIRKAGLNFLPLEKISRSGIGLLSQSKSLRELTQVYRKAAPDIVHHIALKPILFGALAARGLANVRLVNSVMGLGFVFTSESAKARLLRPPMRFALRHALASNNSRTIVQNRDDLEQIATISPKARPHLRLVRGSGVDPIKFSSTPEPPGSPVVILPGRLLKDKGVLEFAAAARQLKAKGRVARFALVGEADAGNPASVTQEQISAWVNEGIVEHWGFRADMPQVYRECHIVCLPSYREGLPRVLIEAAASGRAIVTTDVPGCREVVSHGENGWLVPPRNSAALATALREALNNPERRAAYAASGRRKVEAHFTAEAVIARTLAIYEELLRA